MTVGFLFVESGDLSGRICAEGFVRSVRRSMPGVPIVQFTDEHTAPVAGITDVRRAKREVLAVMRFRHQASVTGEWLFVDTDVLVQRDVRKVFRGTFHLAVTTRNWPHLTAAEGFTEKMPFNTGVVFSRSQKFWQEALAVLEASEIHDADFMGHQQIICDLVASGRYVIEQVKGSKFNCPPWVPGAKGDADVDYKKALSEEMVHQASIVHYKGAQRKQMMLDRVLAEAACA